MDKPNRQNREYTSLFGIVEAISCLTMQVLDIVVLPKHKNSDIDSEEFQK